MSALQHLDVDTLCRALAYTTLMYLCHRRMNLMFRSVHSGIIRTALPNMDREARQEYDVVIQAKDMGGHMGGLSGTTEVKITLTDVNDNPPKFPQSEYDLHPSIHNYLTFPLEESKVKYFTKLSHITVSAFTFILQLQRTLFCATHMCM